MKKYPGNVFMIIAPSGAGKSSLVNALLKNDMGIELSVSCTTRPPRPGEVNGREYHFITVEEFKALQENNDLLEWAEVHGNFYGTPKTFIKQAIAAGKDVLLEIDWQGARQVRQQFAEVTDIFILPPSIEELENRLTRRGQDEPSVIARRLLAAGGEIAHAPECEYVIINNDFDVALHELQQIVATARLRYAAQAARHEKLFAELGISDASSK
ncbi:guanylate kinase [Advenella sp. RU8]|uniref:guanylate kinase n=1 Tax=Advenella sp. RU8 TaxID=3399575 RepID=UPI003AB0242B